MQLVQVMQLAQRFLLMPIFAVSIMFAQAPNLAGVWKADLDKSKLTGPPIKSYLEMIEQSGSKVTETVSSVGERGEDRSVLTFDLDKPAVTPYRGVPTRITATVTGGGLEVNGETAGRPDKMKRAYQLSPDGQTLTVDSTATVGDRQMQSTLVMTKQPDAAAEALRKPQALASEHYKNLKTPLKELQTSQFIDNMRYFAWALGKDCEFCHVRGKFDSDEKEEKRTARVMIEMVNSVNQHTFEGKQEVRCFTCHEFHEHPLARPQFPGEPEHEHEQHGPAGR